jgi:ubiquinone/menaquinone biosynthesis C-methylase UbiE
MHVDIDDWSAYHDHFTQADATQLPFPDKSYDLVILADILEHCENPTRVADEACRVVSLGGRIVITVFEEWKLPGVGQWIPESHQLADELNVSMGYKNREDFQTVNFPKRVGVDDNVISHLAHINQFNDADMELLFQNCIRRGFIPRVFQKSYEATHEGHPWYNWLMSLQRSSA